jgi:colanic acid/amylovoran biosynthesis glycosyltransferase
VKIAYLINQYPQASQSFIRREIRALESLGFEIDRYTVRTWDQELVDPGDREEKSKTRVILAGGPASLVTGLIHALFTRPGRFFRALRTAWRMGKAGDRGRLYHLIYLGEACVLLRWLAERKTTHLHAHFGTNSTAVALLVRELGGPPFSFTCHGPEEFDRPLALKLGDKIDRAAFVVAVSEFGRSQLYRWCPHRHWHKIHVVHCGVDDSFLDQNVPPLTDTAQLVCVGRLAEQKGQLILLEAAVRLRDQHVPFELVLIGDGTMRGEVEAFIRRNNLEGHVVLKGWQSNSDVRREILESRAMILPSFAEGLPVVVMESLALRRPVLSTFVAGIPELVADGITGYLIPAGSVDRLAEAMKRVLQEDVARLREMGAEGARRVAEAHNVSREAEKLSFLFRGVPPKV